MNLFQLILKQMRQRLLGTVLTCISVLLGMALATGILVVGREGRRVFSQTDYGFDMIVGPKGSALQLVLNTIYHIDTAAGTIPYGAYEDLAGREMGADGSRNPLRGMTRWAVPVAVGDSFHGHPIVGTTPQMFGLDEDGKPLPAGKIPVVREGTPFRFSSGRAFAANRFEAVVGSDVARTLGLTVGKTFQATHGFPKPEEVPDVHPETWTIVGVLEETHTANDRVLFIPLMSFYAISEHEEGLAAIGRLGNASVPASAAATHRTDEKPYTMNADGTFTLTLPREQWRVSAVLVQTASAATMLRLPFLLGNSSDRELAQTQGVMPAQTMEGFLEEFLPAVSRTLLMISGLVTAVAGISILVSIYNSVTARHREIAILRALGATRSRILAAVCLEAVLIGLIGGVLGLIAGHLMAWGGSILMERRMATGIAWWRVGWVELVYLPVVVLVAFLAGLVPGIKAYGVTVAEHLG